MDHPFNYTVFSRFATGRRPPQQVVLDTPSAGLALPPPEPWTGLPRGQLRPTVGSGVCGHCPALPASPQILSASSSATRPILACWVTFISWVFATFRKQGSSRELWIRSDIWAMMRQSGKVGRGQVRRRHGPRGREEGRLGSVCSRFSPRRGCGVFSSWCF